MLLPFQNRVRDKIIAEFPSGYIENNEDPIRNCKKRIERRNRLYL